MYLSNTRLISLLFALVVLTLGLLWLFSKQMNLTGPTALKAETIELPLQLAARQAEADTPDKAVTAIPELDPVQELAAARTLQVETNNPAVADPAQAFDKPIAQGQPESAEGAKSSSPAKPLEVAAVPKNLILSEKELKALSAKDRKRYEKMLENLTSLHDQSTQLTNERQRLEQKMHELEQRNLELTRQLEQVRQTTETAVDNKPNP